MRLVISMAIAVAALVGCTPRTYEDCKTEAAKSPTERGVTVAVHACYEKFEAPRKAAELEVAKERAEKIAKTWKTVQGSRSLESAEALIGKPDESIPFACSPFKDDEPAPAKCVLHFWKDPRTPDACGGRGGSPFSKIYSDGFCRWKVQTSQDGTVWATWDEPS